MDVKSLNQKIWGCIDSPNSALNISITIEPTISTMVIFATLFIIFTSMINKDKEVGGTHYSDMKIEPIELIEAFHLDFVQGSIVKYISRYKNKNGVEDLKKALHYCNIGATQFDRVPDFIDVTGQIQLIVNMYCALNGLSDIENVIIRHAISKEFEECAKEIENLIER